MADKTRDEEFLLALGEHTLEIRGIKDEYSKMDMRVLILERLLLLGYDKNPPLVESFRDLDRRLSNFITAYNTKTKEDEEKKEAEIKLVRDDKVWMRRAIIGGFITFFFAAVIPSIWQIIMIWTRIYPILDALSKQP